MSEVVSLVDRIEAFPVVATGVRWPGMREGRASDDYFTRFPECRNDPLRYDYGSARNFPEPFARGGGFFPVLLKMADGKLCCATRTGSCHAGSGGEISLSFSFDRGMKWTDYRAVVRGDPERNIDVRNPALGQAGNGDLVLAYGVMRGIDVRGRVSTPDPYESIQVIRSSDVGVTWSDPDTVPFPEEDLMLHPHGQMRCLSDGTLVFNARGFYTKEAFGRNPKLPARMSYLYRSRDGGKTWSDTTLVRSGGSETGFAALNEVRWLAYVRFNDGPNRIAHSYDGGESWVRWEPAEPESGRHDAGTTGRPGAASPGSVAVLPNGNVLITYGYRAYPFGVRAIVSRDGGNTFDVNREYVISDTAYHPDCGYPSTVCFADGTSVTAAYSLMDVAHPEWGTCCIAYRYPQQNFD
ncbi:MAG: sialidase family protein [Gemmatimonadota bacterium]|nr:sialidase family protein [Gemmatimonadota bacterium]